MPGIDEHALRSFLTRSPLGAVIGLALLAGAPLAPAQTAGADEPPALKLVIFADKLANGYQITRSILTTRSNQFSCVVPAGFRTQLDEGQKKFSLISTDHIGSISLKIVEPANGPAELKPDELRAQVLARQPGAKVVDQTPLTACGGTGPAFEIEWWTETKTRMAMRTAFVPIPGGHLEIVVQARSEKIRSLDGALNQFVLSLRTSPVGSKLTTQAISSNL